MDIILNNRETSFDTDRLSVKEMLSRMKYTFPMIVVKINGQVIKKDQYDHTFIHNGDRVEAIHLISGG